jgi:hypothetical protein
LREACDEGGTGDVECFDGDGRRAFVGVSVEGCCIVDFVGLSLGGDGREGGDAKGFFGVDGGEGACPFVGTLEGVCAIVPCGDRGDTFVLLDGAEGEGESVVGDTEDIVRLAEDAADSTEKGGAGDTEGLRNGGRDVFEVEGVENEAEDQMMGTEDVVGVGQVGRVCRDGGRVKGGDGEVVEDGACCPFLRETSSANERENRHSGDVKGFCVVALLGGDGEEGWCTFVGVRVLEFVEILFGEGGDVEDGDAETGDGGSAFVVGGVENQAEDQMMGMEVGAATGGGVVSCDFGGGESLDWEIGGDGESETDGFGWSGGEIDFGVEDRGPSFVGAFPPTVLFTELCRALRRSIVTWIWLGAPGS